MRDVILHAFNWRYEELTEQAGEIAAAGYGAVLIPPPLYSDPLGAEWWQRYQPKDYRILRSHLGGKRELAAAMAALHAAGVRLYADVVFNHMANEKGSRADCYNFPGEAELARYRAERNEFEADRLYGDLDNGLFCGWDFNPMGDIANWHSLEESQTRWLSGLPDLTLNDWVVAQQRQALAALNALGFDGYRIDAVKHMPELHIDRVFESGDLLASKFLFGESLTSNDHEEHLFLWPLLGNSELSYYDFPLHETMRRAFAPGGSLCELIDPAANGQALPWWRAVTFSVTHDIPYNDGFRSQMLQRQDEYLANAYILGRDGGVPLLFSDHNESAQKFADDRDRWAGFWNRTDTRAMLAFHNAVHGEPQRLLHADDGLLLFARGERGIVTINKSGDWRTARFDCFGLNLGSWRCQLHGHELHLAGGLFELAIPPRQAQLWLWQG